MSPQAPPRSFTKLEALGNDFILLDHRDGRPDPQREAIPALTDRHTGIGCDQLLILRPAPDELADCAVTIYNRDGSPATQCGNGMRAIGLWLHQEQADRNAFVIATASGPVSVRVDNEGSIRVDMGQPEFDPRAVGLKPGPPPAELGAAVPGWLDTGTVSMGNPHLVLLLAEPPTHELVARHGPGLEGDDRFSAGVNVGFVHVPATGPVQLRVFERGTGPTLACGSAACAAAAWLIQGERARSPVEIEQPGGRLVIDWPGPGRTLSMTGPARRVFDGIMR